MSEAPEISDECAKAILDGLARKAALKECTNKQLAEMLTNHVWALIPINTPKSDLVSEAIDRIEQYDNLLEYLRLYHLSALTDWEAHLQAAADAKGE